MILRFSAFLMLCISLTLLQAQEVITTTGGNASGSGGTVSYTIGQVVYTTNIGTNGSIVQGVQQPYEISVVTGFENVKNINLNFSVYPNPTINFLILKIENAELINYSLEIYDINARLIINQKIDNIETLVSLNEFKPANYLLKVFEGKKEVKIFKIIKN